jgi:putative spermidine/putrescine transport system permease protein
MRLSRVSRWMLALYTSIMLAAMYVPLAVIGVLSFNGVKSVAWPPRNLTTKWWRSVLDLKGGPKDALLTSAKLALIAAVIAIVLGTMLSFALHRFQFFGRSVVNFLVVLPIALPGIVTGVALRNAFVRFGVDFGFLTVVIGHATFCIVIAFNNAIARLRRLSPNLQEASADLGADGIQTFRYVTFPLVRSAIVAGGILAFALSFDEVVVTTFTAGAGVETLPQWFLNNLSRPNNVPYVNVVATFVMAVSIPLAWLAQRLSDGSEALTGR